MDRLAKLALALAEGNARYAFLLGSGVSRAVGMPTGWAVLQQLIREYALALRQDPPVDCFAWWRKFQGAEASYSVILETLAPSPSERQTLLQRFWVPTDEERLRGLKVPSAAHNAVAGLAKSRAVRMILTTNCTKLGTSRARAGGCSMWGTAIS